MISFIDVPTPTPLPGQLLRDATNVIQDTQRLTETINNLSVVGLVGLIIVAVILYIVLFRNRGREYQTIINEQARQNQAVLTTFEGIIKDLRREVAEARQETKVEIDDKRREIEKLQEDYRLENFRRDERMIETFRANMDVLAAYTDKASKNGDEIRAIKTGLNTITTEGSPTVQQIVKNTMQIMATLAELVEETRKPNVPPDELTAQIEQFRAMSADIRLIKSAVDGIVERLKRQTDQNPKIENVPQPT